MKNLLKLRTPEQKVANAISLPIALVLMILWYIIKLLTKLLIKFKRKIYKASLMVFVVYGLVSFFIQVANAPKANAFVPHFGNETEHDQIGSYIVEVFGKDSPKAFKLLSCENASLNPDAVNTAGNHPVGSRDIGVFQINEYWQKTQAKFLFNWKINVEIAHQLYVENGNSFKLWTCGRKLGI